MNIEDMRQKIQSICQTEKFTTKIQPGDYIIDPISLRKIQDLLNFSPRNIGCVGLVTYITKPRKHSKPKSIRSLIVGGNYAGTYTTGFVEEFGSNPIKISKSLANLICAYDFFYYEICRAGRNTNYKKICMHKTIYRIITSKYTRKTEKEILEREFPQFINSPYIIDQQKNIGGFYVTSSTGTVPLPWPFIKA